MLILTSVPSILFFFPQNFSYKFDYLDIIEIIIKKCNFRQWHCSRKSMVIEYLISYHRESLLRVNFTGTHSQMFFRRYFFEVCTLLICTRMIDVNAILFQHLYNKSYYKVFFSNILIILHFRHWPKHTPHADDPI